MEHTESPTSRRVRTLLDARGISGSDLARRMGWTQSYASRRLRGSVPWRVDELEQLAVALGIPVAEIVAERAA